MMRLLPLAALLLAGLSASAQITPSTDAPVVGRPMMLTFDAPVDTLKVTYRPNSVAAFTDEIVLGGATETEFTPAHPGIIQVAAGDEKKSLSVRFVSPPISGILVMLLAGIVLFGGAALSMRMLLGSADPDDLTFRPDT